MPSAKKLDVLARQVLLERLERGIVAARLVADRDRHSLEILGLADRDSGGTNTPLGETEYASAYILPRPCEAATFTVQWHAQLTLVSRPSSKLVMAPTLSGVAWVLNTSRNS